MFGHNAHVRRARHMTMTRYPVLDAADERELVVRAKRGDVAARDALVAANLRLVIAITRRFLWSTVPYDDLVQEGNIGLLKALDRFDPDRGVRLATYAKFWIKSYIAKAALEEVDVLRLIHSHARKKVFFRLHRTESPRRARGLPIDDRTIADELDVDEEDVREVRALLRPSLRLDGPLVFDDGSHGSVLDLLSNRDADQETLLVREDRVDAIRRVVESLREEEDALDHHERFILSERLLSEEPMTLERIAGLVGRSRERMRQLEAETLQKIRLRLLKTFPNGLVDAEIPLPDLAVGGIIPSPDAR